MPVASHRPFVPTNVQRPRSRSQTARFTSAGMWREPGLIGRPWTRGFGGGELLPRKVVEQRRDRPVEQLSGLVSRRIYSITFAERTVITALLPIEKFVLPTTT